MSIDLGGYLATRAVCGKKASRVVPCEHNLSPASTIYSSDDYQLDIFGRLRHRSTATSNDTIEQSTDCLKSAIQVTNESETTMKPIIWSDYIPTELVANIFSFVVEEQENWWDRESPLLLCAVCRKWRSIAISTPRLWRTVKLRFKRPLDNEYELVLLQQWLDRAAAVPLYLYLGQNIYPYGANQPDLDTRMKNMENIISSVLPRSSTVLIRLQDGPYLKLATAFSIDIPYKLLEEIRFTAPNLSSKTIDLRACTNLILGILHPYRRFEFGDNQFHSLRHLVMTGNMHDIYQILSRFPSVEEYRHIAEYDASDRAVPPALKRAPHLKLPNLEAFDVEWDGTDDIWRVFDRLSIPSLQKFGFQHQNLRDTHWHWPSLFSLFQRSRPPMRYLEICNLPIVPESQLMELLSWMPALKGLKLMFLQDSPLLPRSNILTAKFWGAFTGLHALQIDPALQEERGEDSSLLAGTPTCPHLERFHLHLSRRVQLTEVATVITSLFPNYDHASFHSLCVEPEVEGKTLRSLVLGECDFSMEDFLAYPQMEKYVKAGLIVSMTPWDCTFKLPCEFPVCCITL